MLIFIVFHESVTDGQTDGQTDGRTDIPGYRDARTHLKKLGKTGKKGKKGKRENPVSHPSVGEAIIKNLFQQMKVEEGQRKA